MGIREDKEQIALARILSDFREHRAYPVIKKWITGQVYDALNVLVDKDDEKKRATLQFALDFYNWIESNKQAGDKLIAEYAKQREYI